MDLTPALPPAFHKIPHQSKTFRVETKSQPGWISAVYAEIHPSPDFILILGKITARMDFCKFAETHPSLNVLLFLNKIAPRRDF